MVGMNVYKLSDNVVVYHKNSSGGVMRMTMDEAINGDYKLLHTMTNNKVMAEE